MLANYIIVYSGLILTILFSKVINTIDGSSSTYNTVTPFVDGYAPNGIYESLSSFPGGSYGIQPLENPKMPARDKLSPVGISNTLTYSTQPGASYAYGDMPSYYYPQQSSQGKINDQFIPSYTGKTPDSYTGQYGANGIPNSYYAHDWRGQATQQIVPTESYYSYPYGYEPGRTLNGGVPTATTNPFYGNQAPSSIPFYQSLPSNQNLYVSQSYVPGQVIPIDGVQSDYSLTKLATSPMVVENINLEGSKRPFPDNGITKYQEISVPLTGTPHTNIVVPSDQNIHSMLQYPSAAQPDRLLQSAGGNQNIVSDHPLQSAGGIQTIANGSPTEGYTPYKKPEKLTMDDLFSYSSFSFGDQFSTTGTYFNKNPLRFKLMTSIISSLVDLPLQLIRSLLSTINKHLPDINAFERLLLGMATANAVHDGLQQYIYNLQNTSKQNRTRRSVRDDSSPEYVNLGLLPELPEGFAKYVKDKISEQIPADIDEETIEKFLQDIMNDLRYALAPQFKFLKNYYIQ